MCLYLLKREVERKVRGVRVNGEGGGSQGGMEIEASSFFRRAQDVPFHTFEVYGEDSVRFVSERLRERERGEVMAASRRHFFVAHRRRSLIFSLDDADL